jgi:DNA-binding transcriptional MerR regulator
MSSLADNTPEKSSNDPDREARDAVADAPQARTRHARRAKSADAFRTISEVADELEVQQHVLRFWETRFNQIKPLKRGGGRRYYRPEDVNLLRGIRRLLHEDGYTIKGVQKVLREKGVKALSTSPEDKAAAAAPAAADIAPVAVVDPRAPAGMSAQGTTAPEAGQAQPVQHELSPEKRTKLESLLAELVSIKERLNNN